MTDVTFLSEPTNLDYLIPRLRMAIGDIAGDKYSDVLLRTALTYGVNSLESRWYSRYQIFWDYIVAPDQPDDKPGYIWAHTTHGDAYIPEGLAEGSAFRNPFIAFTQKSPPTIQSDDEEIILLSAQLILLKAQIRSSADSFVSWSTEDIRYNNSYAEKSLSSQLDQLNADIKAFFNTGLGASQLSHFAPVYTGFSQIYYEETDSTNLR